MVLIEAENRLTNDEPALRHTAPEVCGDSDQENAVRGEVIRRLPARLSERLGTTLCREGQDKKNRATEHGLGKSSGAAGRLSCGGWMRCI